MMQETSGRLRSFGRVRGRKLKLKAQARIDELLPLLTLTLPYVPDDSRPLWLEIGFGGGEHLVEQARRHPEALCVGCEPYVNGVASLLAHIGDRSLENIRLFQGDARTLLDRLPDASLDRIFILFPDPWPKARHHKRRLIQRDFLQQLADKTKLSGTLRVATDDRDYAMWILEHMAATPEWFWTATRAADWENPPSDWVRTRYQAKAEAEGRSTLYFEWRPIPTAKK